MQKLSIFFFHLESRMFIKKALIKGMIRLVCESLLCGASLPNMVTGCLKKLFKWINDSRQRV